MTRIVMRTLAPPVPIVSTYSGVVTPDANGYVSVDVRDVALFQIEGFFVPAVNNTNSQTDPTATNDQSQGYGLGSFWLNTVYPRLWLCQSATPGAAVWVLLFQSVTSH